MTSHIKALAVLLAAGISGGAGGPASQPATTASSPAGTVNLLQAARWEYSADDGRTWAPQPPVIPFGSADLVLARVSFQVDDPGRFAALELTHGMPPRGIMVFSLNGERIRPPLPDMYYLTIPAIPADLLVRGRNVLTAKIAYDNRLYDPYRTIFDVPVALPNDLTALPAGALKVQTGPILGAAGPDFFTVSLRTNLPAKAELRYGPEGTAGVVSVAGESVQGLFHRFRVTGLEPGKGYDYRCVVRALKDETAQVWSRRGQARTLRKDGLRFVVMGDSRTIRPDWLKVSAAVAKERPDLLVFTGDMTDSGREDWRWDEHFCGPAAELLANVPFYAVLGNHEEDAAVVPLLFATPGPRAACWSQEVAGVLLAGIDGQEDWTPDSANHKWLRKTLSESKAKFVFVFSHYPGWSSGVYGYTDGDTGLAYYWEVRQARECILPLLQRYGVTAFAAAHDHMYERSELPAADFAGGGKGSPLTLIISGRAGAPARQVPEEFGRRQNPFSKVVSFDLHYCVIETRGDRCLFKAVTPDGKEIDSRSWHARALP